MMTRNDGQILIPVILIVMLLAMLVPAVVNWTQGESQASVNDLKYTRAAELAEAGVDLGLKTLIQSSSTWSAILGGGIPVGFNFDSVYNDIGLGSYSIRISSGPGPQQATVVSVGRDKTSKSLRTIKAVYQNSVSQTALYAINGMTFQNNVNVEWGPIVSLGPFTTDVAHTYPRLYGNDAILPHDTNAALVPNTDNQQWWSYQSILPPTPQVDVQSYRAVAQGMGGAFFNTGSPSYSLAVPTLPGTYYFDNDTTLTAPGGATLHGDLIVDGNLTINFVGATGADSTTLPPTAWQEYSHNWTHYQTYDLSAPAAFPGINANYVSPPAVLGLSNVAVHGFVYMKKQLVITSSPGGPVNFIGAMYVGNTTALTPAAPAVTLYFDSVVAATVKTVNITLNRISWQNVTTCGWAGAFPTCP